MFLRPCVDGRTVEAKGVDWEKSEQKGHRLKKIVFFFFLMKKPYFPDLALGPGALGPGSNSGGVFNIFTPWLR